MKLDAQDKYKLRDKKDINSNLLNILFLLFIILLLVLILSFILYTGKTKLTDSILKIEGIDNIYKDEFYEKFKNFSILQVILPNFKKIAKKLYFVEDIKIKYIPAKNISIKIEPKPIYCIIYDRVNGFFYAISKDKTVLKEILDLSILNYTLISIPLNKKFYRGDILPVDFSNLEFYNKDPNISEIILEDDNYYATCNFQEFMIFFGSFVSRAKMDNLSILMSIMLSSPNILNISNANGSQGFQNKKILIDLSYPFVGRIKFIDG
ncbi:MAG: hypothetical protein KBG82_04800 [Spirochaetes bacterium]|nr:hypothetical protein [Spirochaetota bacterium]NLJ04484.1 hypothetical protein [Exilispira sp.]MBP8991277.1 hypothetical protein [Spirochaetota bacterium]HNV43909.1 hypothetical protein [Exilispira sp.]HOV46022.1 hypothetical protein [Exilispira sp.]